MIGTESSKTFKHKMENGFFQKYMSGVGVEVGYKGYTDAYPILNTAIGVDLDMPGYDGLHLPFNNQSQDYVYASHTLEHISDYKIAIYEWFRVTKINGHIVIVVPHRDLYEKKFEPPSRFNPDHKRFYTPTSLLWEVEQALPTNSYRVRHMRDNDEGHNYSQPATEHSVWLYEIELVIQRIK